MDQTDSKILLILQKNGRISMKELVAQVGLSAPAVAERVKRLEEKAVILSYRAVIDPVKLGKNISAFIMADAFSNKYQAIVDYANQNSNIIECHHTIGKNCLMLKVYVENTEQLKDIIIGLKPMAKTETYVNLCSIVDFKPISQ